MTDTFKKSACLVLFLAGFLLYSNTLRNGFVWDDHYLVEENHRLENSGEILNFFMKDFWQNSSLDFKSGFYRPVTLLSFFINHHLWGGAPLGFHLFNILLHAINGVLVFLLFLRLTGKDFIAFLTGLFFLIHPAQSEAVAYIADVNDLLVVFFLLFTFYFYLGYADTGKKRYISWSLFFFVFALLSKEIAMIGGVLILLLDLMFIRPKSKQRLPAIGLYFLITVIYIAIRGFLLGPMNAVTTLENIRYVSVLPSFDIWSHLLTTAKILFLYMKLCVFPADLTVSYVVLPAVTIFSPDIFFAVLAIALSAILMARLAKTEHRLVSFSFFWFFITILPLSNLIPISNTVAERFLYLPMIGFVFLLANAVDFLKTRLKKNRAGWVFYAAFSFLLLSFSQRTIARNFDWQSDFTLFQSASSSLPCAPIAHKNLSVYYFRQNEAAKAREEEQKYAACLASIQEEYKSLKAKIK